MANEFDLEEQEQLDQIKHFWQQYGNLISWVLIAVFGSIAAWNGWNYWQSRQAGQASVMYDEVERAAVAGNTDRVERAFSDMKAHFGRTTYAQQAGLLAAAALYDKGKADQAKAALAWVADKASDEGYQAVARLRLASIFMDAKQYDEALKQLNAAFPREFQALADDRRGDIYNLQGKKTEAKAEYEKAYKGMDDRSDARKLLEVKLAALGVDAKQLAAPAAVAGAKS
ncbi:MAG TPA: tetratricopeptide repeat protein [Ramlibacter sp.]|nr:tetratricopeptide repeat protein [Ramlibacter sp.]